MIIYYLHIINKEFIDTTGQPYAFQLKKNCQAFSQDLKSGCPKCAIGWAKEKDNIWKIKQFSKKIAFYRMPGHPSG